MRDSHEAGDSPGFEGLRPGCGLQRTLLEDLPQLDAGEAEREVVAAAERLLARSPGLQSIVLECTNLPPYRDAVAAATHLPVHDIGSLLRSRWAELERAGR